MTPAAAEMPGHSRPAGAAPDDLPDLLVVTPWYPNPDNPYAGAFVRESVRSLMPYYDDIVIVHAENLPADDRRAPEWRQTPEGRVLWVPVPMDPLTPRGEMILRQREALQAHAADLLAHEQLIHCHVGAPTAAAIAPLLKPDARFVVTEHSSALGKVLRDPQARGLYEEAYRRADVFGAVNETMAWTLQTVFPDVRDHVPVLVNPVPLRGLPAKQQINPAMSRWLYIGNLVAAKGVARLVRSFAAWVSSTRDAAARLTVVGDGPMRSELEALADDLGISDKVDWLGRLEPDAVGSVYAAHDLLVHLSHQETFGLTCVEAAACGLPVVVTQCGGPQNTLMVHASLGLAEFIPVSDEFDTEPVLEAISRLQRTVDPANLALSRHHLQRAYGSETVGRHLHAVLADEEVPSREVPDGMRVLAVAMTQRQADKAESALNHFGAYGGGGIYITAVPPRAILPSSVRVIDISGIEQHAFVSQVERLVVLKAPALGLRAAGRAAELTSRVAPPAGRVGTRLVARLQTRHRRMAHEFRYRGPYSMFWRSIGPWHAARTMEAAGTFAALDLQNIDCVIMPDEFMIPLVVRALKENPELDVRSRWTRRAVARQYAERVLASVTVSGGEGDEDDIDVGDDAGTVDAVLIREAPSGRSSTGKTSDGQTVAVANDETVEDNIKS